MNPICIVMCGIPGAGKTTVRDDILRKLQPLEFDVIAPDDMIERIGETTGTFYRDIYMNEEARRICYDAAWYRLHQAMLHQRNVLIDRTHLDVPHRAKALASLSVRPGEPSVYKCYAVTVVPPPDPQEWVSRLDKRPGKTIPPATLFQMVRGFSYPTVEEGFVECFVGPSEGELSRLVAESIKSLTA